MEQIILSSIPLELIEAKISQLINSAILNKQQADLKEKLLSPAETCKLFQPSISKVTLHKWTKEGRIQEHRMGGRVYYKYSEVIQSLQTLKKMRRA